MGNLEGKDWREDISGSVINDEVIYGSIYKYATRWEERREKMSTCKACMGNILVHSREIISWLRET